MFMLNTTLLTSKLDILGISYKKSMTYLPQ